MTSEGASILTPGRPFGRYEVGRMIGAGGMAEVYEAHFPALRKRVAIKVLNTKAAADSDAARRFLREGEAAARIRHPHVVEVFDLGTEQGIPFLVMELLEGEDLGTLLDRERQLSVERTADILIPASAGVAAAHDEGIVHRDLKPENVFLARSREGTWEPKIVDFGISKLNDPTSGGLGMTATAAFLGTPYYVSPEQAHGAKVTDARSDQYALGVIAYECLTGERPYQGETFLALMHAIVRGVYPAPRTIRPDIPPAFEAAIAHAMAASPAHRFESVRAFARELLPYASGPVRAHWEPRLQQTHSGQRPLPAPSASHSGNHFASTSPIGRALTPSGPHGSASGPMIAPTLQSPLPSAIVGGRGRPASTLGASVRDVPLVPKRSRVGVLVAGLGIAALLGGGLVFTVLLVVSPGSRSVTANPSAPPSTSAATAPTPPSIPSAPPIPTQVVAPVAPNAPPTTAAIAPSAVPAPTPPSTPVAPATPSANAANPTAIATAAAAAASPTTSAAPSPEPSTTAGSSDTSERARARRSGSTSGMRRSTPGGSTPVRIGTRGAPILGR